MISPCSVRVESHPSGALIDLVLDVNRPDHVKICLTRDLAVQVKAGLAKALEKP